FRGVEGAVRSGSEGQVAARNDRPQGEEKLRMYRNPAGVQGGDARGRHDDERLMGTRSKIFQKCGLARSGLSCKKNMCTRAVDESDSKVRNAFMEHVSGQRVFIFVFLFALLR